MAKQDIRSVYITRQRIADDAKVAFEKAIKEAQSELYDYLTDDDVLQNWVHDKVYDLLPQYFALNPKNIDKPISQALEFTYGKLYDPIVKKPNR